jgi:glutamate/tyrosine decarboxylase-like PLP-dependent enzyme
MTKKTRKATKALQVRTKRSREEILEQLKKVPIVQIACERSGIGRSTFYRFKRTDPEFAAAADHALREGIGLVTDLAESQLISSIKNQNMPAVMFWLKHHHPTYKTKLEVNGFVHHTAERLTPEQEKVVREAIRLASFSIPLAKLYEPENPTEDNRSDAE